MTDKQIILDHGAKWVELEEKYRAEHGVADFYSTRQFEKMLTSALDKKKRGGFKITPWIMRTVTRTGIADL